MMMSLHSTILMQIIVNHYCSDGGINQLAAVLIVYHEYDLAVIVNEMVAAMENG